MPTNIQTVEISGDYESINSFSAFKKLLRNIFTTPAPMFSFLEAKNISANNFISGYISGNRVYVSLVSGLSYLFEINNDSYVDISKVSVPPEEPPDIEVPSPSPGRTIEKISPTSTEVPLTSETNYIANDPIETPTTEDETLAALGIYSDRPALLSVMQYAYSDDLFELVKEYRISKIQECKSKIDGLDPEIRTKLQKEYSDEMQKVNSLISFSNKYLEIQSEIASTLSTQEEKESSLVDYKLGRNLLQSTIDELESTIENLKNQLTILDEIETLKLTEEQSITMVNINENYFELQQTVRFGQATEVLPKVQPLLFFSVGYLNNVRSTLKQRKEYIDILLEDVRGRNAYQLRNDINVLNLYNYLFAVLKYTNTKFAPDLVLTNTSKVAPLDEDQFDEIGEWYDTNRSAIFRQVDDLKEEIEDRRENARLFAEKLAQVEEEDDKVVRASIDAKTEELSGIEALAADQDVVISSLESEIEVLILQISKLKLSLINLPSLYPTVDELFKIPGFDLNRYTSFLSEQEIITIQRQKQMYQANSAIGFLPRKEIQVYNEVQWYLLKRYAEFLDNLDNPRLLTFGIPSNAEEELGGLLAAEVQIRPEDGDSADIGIKHEGPIFLYSKDLFLAMKNDFSISLVDDVFDETTTFLQFRSRLRSRVANFFTRFIITKDAVTETASSGVAPNSISTFRTDIQSFYEQNGDEPPLSLLSGNYKTSHNSVYGNNAVAGNDVPFHLSSIFVNHAIDFLTKELQKIYGGVALDVDSFPLDDRAQSFVVSSNAIDSIESLSSDAFESNIPLSETLSDPIIMSQLVSPGYSLRKICSDKVFFRTFSVFIDEKMFPVTTTLVSLYSTSNSLVGTAWKRSAPNNSFKWKTGEDYTGLKKYAFFKKANHSYNTRAGNLQIVIYHNGPLGLTIGD